MALIYAHTYVNPIKVGRACADRLLEVDHMKKVAKEYEDQINETIKNHEADSEIQSLFAQVMHELGLTCEYFPTYGMKLMGGYGMTSEETKQKLMSILEGIKQTKVIYSIHDDNDLERLKHSYPSLVSEIQAWRSAFPNSVNVM